MNDNKRLVKRIFRKIRDANLRYHLIEDGDVVAVGISGGKDSLTLLHFLSLLQRYTPLKFELKPIMLDLGVKNDNSSAIEFCKARGLELLIVPTDIAKIVFDVRQEKSPCSLCANLRRGLLNSTAKSLGCNKVALGHHLDDAVSTFYMSIIYEQRFHSFKPLTWLDRIGIYKIEPLVYVEEKEIRQFVESEGIVPVHNNCPADGITKRSDISDFLTEINERYPDFSVKMINAIENMDMDSLWRPDLGKN